MIFRNEMKPIRDQSEFNDALGYLNQINALFFSCIQAKFDKDKTTWYDALSGLFTSLSTFMEKDELKQNYEELQVLAELVYDDKSGIPGINKVLYWKLLNYEMRMRMITKVSGLQTKLKEFDPHSAL